MKDEYTVATTQLHELKNLAKIRDMDLEQLKKHKLQGEQTVTTLQQEKGTLEIEMIHALDNARGLKSELAVKEKEKKIQLKCVTQQLITAMCWVWPR